ncbi:MAG: general stress protein CsbD [Perlabentimonas sp.]
MENYSVGFWNERKGKLKEKYPDISDEDLNFHKNKEKEMMERLSYKLGKTKEELRTIVNTIK